MKDKIEKALNVIEEWSFVDGDFHKQWVLDQVVRILADDYEEWVSDYQDGEDGPETYDWDKGIAP